MPAKMTNEEYLASLSRKIAGSAVIFRDESGDILIVKPDYRDDWLLPGGSIDEDESPQACAIRETEEEIGLTISNPRLVGMCYSRKENFCDGFTFFFDGGVLDDNAIDTIVLQEDELLEFRFVSTEEGQSLLNGAGSVSLSHCLAAIESGTTAYIER